MHVRELFALLLAFAIVPWLFAEPAPLPSVAAPPVSNLMSMHEWPCAGNDWLTWTPETGMVQGPDGGWDWPANLRG